MRDAQDEPEKNEFKCKECGNPIPRELMDNYILRGKKIYCERCGIPFKTKITKKEYKKIQEIEKEREEEIEQKIEQQIEVKTVTPVLSSRESTEDIQGSIYKRNHHKRNNYKRNEYKKTEFALKKVPENVLKDMEKCIGFLNNIIKSPLILIVAMLITLGRITGMFFTPPVSVFRISNTFFNLIVLILFSNYARTVIAIKISEKDYSNMGVDAIIIGSACLAAYGITSILLIEGILVLVHQILLKRNKLIGHKNKSLPMELSNEILASNILGRIIFVINSILYKATGLIILLGFPLLTNEFNFSKGIFWMYLGFFFVSFFMLLYIKKRFSPTIYSTSYTEISEDLIIFAIILAGLSLTFAGSGVPLMVLCILLFIYRGMNSEISKKLKKYQAIKDSIQPKTVHGQQKPLQQENKIFQPKTTESTELTEPKTTVPVNLSSKKISIPEELTPIPADTVQTQSDRDKKELPEIPEIPVIRKNGSREGKEISTEKEFKRDPERQAKIDLYLDRLFTVLSEETRERLLNLDIPEKQKWEVVREFVNLKEEQQKKFLEELEDVNRKISSDLIGRIINMKISNGEKQDLLKQLEYIPFKDQEEFVKFVESNVESKK
ncbi:MAG: hypothetical protein ACTSWY_00025 [Promethearchaeota archaeon]